MFKSTTPIPLYRSIPSCSSSFIPPCSCERLWPWVSRSCPPKLPEAENHDHQSHSEQQHLTGRLVQTWYLCLELRLAPPHFALCVQRRFDARESRARVLQRWGKLTNGIIDDIGSKNIKNVYISVSLCLIFLICSCTKSRALMMPVRLIEFLDNSQERKATSVAFHAPSSATWPQTTL